MFSYIKIPKGCQLDITKKTTKGFKKRACKRYQDLPGKEKGRHHQYDCKQYKGLTKDENKGWV